MICITSYSLSVYPECTFTSLMTSRIRARKRRKYCRWLTSVVSMLTAPFSVTSATILWTSLWNLQLEAWYRQWKNGWMIDWMKVLRRNFNHTPLIHILGPFAKPSRIAYPRVVETTMAVFSFENLLYTVTCHRERCEDSSIMTLARSRQMFTHTYILDGPFPIP